MFLFGKPNIEDLKSKGQLKKLFKIASSRDDVLRKKASKAIVEMGPSTIESLLKSLKQKDTTKNNVALGIFVAMGESAVDPLIGILKNKKHSSRSIAVEALGKIGDKRANELVVDSILDADCLVSSKAMYAAKELLGEKAQNNILVKLRLSKGNAKEIIAEKAAIQVLGDIGEKKAINEIFSILQNRKKDHEDNGETALALGKLAGRVKNQRQNQGLVLLFTELIESHLESNEYQSILISSCVSRALGEFSSTSSSKVLLKALKSQNPLIRASAAYGLRGAMDEQKVPILMNALHDSSSEVRAMAIETLGLSGDGRCIGAIKECLGDMNHSVKEKAILALGNFNDSSLTEHIIPFLNEERWELRLNAALTLRLLGGKDALNALVIQMEKETEPCVQDIIRFSLNELESHFICEENETSDGSKEKKESINVIDDVIRGGLGEPYCSCYCHEKSEKEVAKLVLNGVEGKCSFCDKKIEVSMYGSSQGSIVPFEGKKVFVCDTCLEEAKKHFHKSQKCSFCEVIISQFKN